MGGGGTRAKGDDGCLWIDADDSKDDRRIGISGDVVSGNADEKNGYAAVKKEGARSSRPVDRRMPSALFGPTYRVRGSKIARYCAR